MLVCRSVVDGFSPPNVKKYARSSNWVISPGIGVLIKKSLKKNHPDVYKAFVGNQTSIWSSCFWSNQHFAKKITTTGGKCRELQPFGGENCLWEFTAPVSLPLRHLWLMAEQGHIQRFFGEKKRKTTWDSRKTWNTRIDWCTGVPFIWIAAGFCPSAGIASPTTGTCVYKYLRSLHIVRVTHGEPGWHPNDRIPWIPEICALNKHPPGN